MEIVAEAAVSIAVETLGKLLVEKAEFLIGVKGDVEWLQKELKSIQCFLKDAAKKQSESESIRNWISDIRAVAHDAEDAIEIFVRKGLNKRYGCFPNHLSHLNNVGEQIKSIRQTLIDIQDRRVRYGIQEDEPTTRMRSQAEEIEARRRIAYWKPDGQVVGLDEDVRKLLRESVFEKSKGLSVAAILGMGGMGKSTLATKIYNHPEVADEFGFRAWVVVSSEFSPENILKQILKQLGISLDDKLLESMDSLSRQDYLKREIHTRLASKRYFIVLDDVWEADHWETLSTAFPDGDKQSRVLLTSRNPVITMNSGYVHDMKPLDANESWDLFMRKAFGGNTSVDGCPEELKTVGGKILKKCGGLPLAISVVGGLLAKKTRSKSEWEKVYKEMNSYLDRNRGDLHNITAILELSYRNLPLELKACFLSFGFFKEDAMVEVKRLVQIWIAQGLVVQEVGGEQVRMEDVAREYINELISRNMVQVEWMEVDRVIGCRIHDLLRDLSIRIAKEELDFEVLIEDGNSHQNSLAKPRHRALYGRGKGFIFSTNRNQHLRSLFVHLKDDKFLSVSSGSSSYWKSFELLRVLDMEDRVAFDVLPKGIGELTGLRYLRLYFDGGEMRLPSSWAKLKNLEVLDLRAWRGIKLDKVILKMESLRHLYGWITSCEVGLGNTKLETLPIFWVRSRSDFLNIKGMRCLSKLGIDMSCLSKLGIDMRGRRYDTSYLLTCLSSLENLSYLDISSICEVDDIKWLTSMHHVTRLRLHTISPYNTVPVYFPPYLSHFTMENMPLKKDAMVVLEKLPYLMYLNLDFYDSDDKEMMVITSGGFPSLKVLEFQNISEWFGSYKMEIEESAMPELNQFIIRQCPTFDVGSLPDRIKAAVIRRRD